MMMINNNNNKNSYYYYYYYRIDFNCIIGAPRRSTENESCANTILQQLHSCQSSRYCDCRNRHCLVVSNNDRPIDYFRLTA